jgi:hypothetical protein
MADSEEQIKKREEVLDVFHKPVCRSQNTQ